MISNENSVLVYLEASFWGAYKKDKQATEAALTKYNMAKGTMNSNKKLIAKHHLKPMKDIINEFKTYFQDNTLPYNLATATRILPTEQFFEFKQKENECIRRLKEEVEIFQAGYEKAIEDAQERLGDLFNIGDYPDIDQLPFKFKINVTYLPVPAGDQFNDQISNTVVSKLNSSMENMSHTVTMDLFLRAEKAVQALHNIIVTNAKRIFHSTTQGNIEKLLDQMEKLNYNNNPDIVALRELIQEELGNVRVDYIKNSQVYRDKIKKKTTAILTKIAEYHEQYSI